MGGRQRRPERSEVWRRQPPLLAIVAPDGYDIPGIRRAGDRRGRVFWCRCGRSGLGDVVGGCRSAGNRSSRSAPARLAFLKAAYDRLEGRSAPRRTGLGSSRCAPNKPPSCSGYGKRCRSSPTTSRPRSPCCSRRRGRPSRSPGPPPALRYRKGKRAPPTRLNAVVATSQPRSASGRSPAQCGRVY